MRQPWCALLLLDLHQHPREQLGEVRLDVARRNQNNGRNVKESSFQFQVLSNVALEYLRHLEGLY